jgi:hypothetical protein
LLNESAGGPGITSESFRQFATNSPSFLVTVSTTATPNAGIGAGVSAGIYDDSESGGDDEIASPFVDAGETGSFLIREGTGLYSISAAATDTKYTIIVKECTGAGTGNAGTGTAADHQYNAGGKEVTVIVETIPDQKVLVDTGGPSAATVLGMFLAVGFIGTGIVLLRRT